MEWRAAEFKGQNIWARVDPEGKLLVKGGRVEIRYRQTEGVKIYRGTASQVHLKAEAPILDLPDGIPADQAQTKSQGAKTSGAKTAGLGFGKAGTRTAAQAALARDVAQAIIKDLTGKAILCFTDGACKGNPGVAGSGAWIQFTDGETVERHLALGVATNNIAELRAIALALDVLDEKDVASDAQVAVFTDSNYANGVLVKGWKAKANTELIQALRPRIQARPGLTIYWVAGHAGIDGNERADALANLGCTESVSLLS